MPSPGSLLAALALTPAIAVASPGGGSIAPDISHKTFILSGMAFGGVVNSDNDHSWLVGAESSVVHIWELAWIGGYVDMLVEGDRDQLHASVGGEVGYSVFGIDVGPVFELGGEGHIGLRFRPALTIGALSLCGGPVLPLFGGGDAWGEGSVLVKFPIR